MAFLSHFPLVTSIFLFLGSFDCCLIHNTDWFIGKCWNNSEVWLRRFLGLGKKVWSLSNRRTANGSINTSPDIKIYKSWADLHQKFWLGDGNQPEYLKYFKQMSHHVHFQLLSAHSVSLSCDCSAGYIQVVLPISCYVVDLNWPSFTDWKLV